MIVLDADIVSACVDYGHAYTSQALELLDTEEELTVHPLTLAECAVSAADKGYEPMLRALVEQVGVTIWSPDPKHSQRLRRLHAATSLDLLECCALDVAEHEHATLATFDARLVQVARIRMLPVLTLTTARRAAELT